MSSKSKYTSSSHNRWRIRQRVQNSPDASITKNQKSLNLYQFRVETYVTALDFKLYKHWKENLKCSEIHMKWNRTMMQSFITLFRVPDFENNPTKIFMCRNKIDNPPFFFNKNTPVSQCLTISASSNIMTPIIWSTHQPFTTSAPKTKHKYYITSR